MGQQSSKKSRKATKEKDKDASSDGSPLHPSPDQSPEAAAQPALSRPDDASTSTTTTNGSESSLNGNSASSAFGV